MTEAINPDRLAALRAQAVQQARLQTTYGKEGLELKIEPALAIQLVEWIEQQQGYIKANQVELGEQDAKIQKLNADLVAEAARTAAEKLRADQLGDQHRMQSAMHAEARQLLIEEQEATDNWRRLALQFDGHRMQALGYLKALLKGEKDLETGARGFIASPPIPGEQVLAERIAAMAKHATSTAAQKLPEGNAGWFKYDKISQCWHPQHEEYAATHAKREGWQRLYTEQQVRGMVAEQAAPGWKLVPVEPTREMLAAGDQKTWVLPSRDCYAAMLAAAPTPPALERKPLTDEQIDALWGGENVSVPQLVNRRAISRSIERAHGIGATNAD